MPDPARETERGRLALDFHRDPDVLGELARMGEIGLFTVDAQGLFVAWSRGAEVITGYTADEVRGKPCSLLDGPECKGFSGVLDLLTSADPDLEGIARRECRLRRGGSRPFGD